MPNDPDASKLTDEQHDWIHAFTGISSRIQQAVTDGAHAIEKAATPAPIAETVDKGVEGAIDKGTAAQKKAIDDLPVPGFLKSVAKGAAELQGGFTKGLVKVGSGLLQGAQDATDMMDGAMLVRGGAKVAAAIVNEDDRARLLKEAEASGKALESRAEMIVNPAGYLAKAGAGVVDGYQKAAAAGKALDYVGTVGGQVVGTVGLMALGEAAPELAGEVPPGEVPPVEAPPVEAPPMEPVPDTVPQTQPGLGVDPVPPHTIPGVGPEGPPLPAEPAISPAAQSVPPPEPVPAAPQTIPGVGPEGPPLPAEPAISPAAQSVPPPEPVPPTEMPPTEMPPTEMPPTEMPPTEMPPTEKVPDTVPQTQRGLGVDPAPPATIPGVGPEGPPLPPEPAEPPISEPPPGQRVPVLPQLAEPAPAAAEPAAPSGEISSTPPSMPTIDPTGIETPLPAPGTTFNPAELPPPPKLPDEIPGYGKPGEEGWQIPPGTEVEAPITKPSPTAEDG